VDRVNGLQLKQYFQSQPAETSPSKISSTNITHISKTSWMDAQNDSSGYFTTSLHYEQQYSSFGANKRFLESNNMFDSSIGKSFDQVSNFLLLVLKNADSYCCTCYILYQNHDDRPNSSFEANKGFVELSNMIVVLSIEKSFDQVNC